MAGRTFAPAQRGKRQSANPSPPSGTAGVCPKISKVDGSVNKRCLATFHMTRVSELSKKMGFFSEIEC
jgi:hypothetical protein